MQQSKSPSWLQQQKLQITGQFLDSLWRDLLILTAVVLPVSLLRIFHTGWLNLYLVHLSVGAIVIFTGLYRHRLPLQFKGFLIVTVMLVLGAGGLFSFGLAANGTFWLICGCLITGFLYSTRTMYLVCALALAIFLANFVGYSTGLLHSQTNLDLYMQGVSSWLNFLLTAVMMVFILHRAVQAQQQKLMAVTQHQYRQWLDDLPLALEVVDLEQKVYYQNHAVRRLFGQDSQASAPQAGVPMQLLAHLRDKNTGAPLRASQLPAAAALRGENHFIDAATLQTSQGETVVRCWGWPGYREDGQIGYGITVFEDVSRQALAEQHKNEFIANVSHELRTPLTAIRASIGLIMGGALGDIPKRAEEMARICQQNSDRLLFLVNDLLDLQKIEQGKLEVTAIPVDASQLLRACAQNLQGYAQEFGSKILFNDQAPHAVVNLDPDRLQQVVANLLSNAVKFSPKHSIVMMWARCEDHQLIIGVQDQGCGIPAVQQHRIFEPFVQLDQQPDHNHPGTGLGLSISKKLVEYMGGQISFSSQEGLGTTFELRFPLLVE
ncbi:MAG: PAS domain-containing sensor histidine kinase [Rheinheimera sp.]|nr:PAS domain-containing sensor histidine kinase [Rheinheimera sp.]